MNWGNLSNEELLRLYGEGHFGAFDAFFKRNSKAVFLFIMSRAGDQAEAEDILQDTFLRIHKYIHRYDCKSSALNWVFAIAKNQMLTHMGKRSYHTELDETQYSSRPLYHLEARDELKNILSQLDHEDSTLLADKFLQEESYDEISSKRGWTAVNTRQRVSRILKKIRSGV